MLYVFCRERREEGRKERKKSREEPAVAAVHCSGGMGEEEDDDEQQRRKRGVEDDEREEGRRKKRGIFASFLREQVRARREGRDSLRPYLLHPSQPQLTCLIAPLSSFSSSFTTSSSAVGKARYKASSSTWLFLPLFSLPPLSC